MLFTNVHGNPNQFIFNCGNIVGMHRNCCTIWPASDWFQPVKNLRNSVSIFRRKPQDYIASFCDEPVWFSLRYIRKIAWKQLRGFELLLRGFEPLESSASFSSSSKASPVLTAKMRFIMAFFQIFHVPLPLLCRLTTSLQSKDHTKVHQLFRDSFGAWNEKRAPVQ